MEFLILQIQEIVRTKDLESGASWDQMKLLMHAENKNIPSGLLSDLLDKYKIEIETSFNKCIVEELRRAKQELQRMRMFQEQGRARPISPPRSRSSSASGCREPLQDDVDNSVCEPTLDDTRSGPGVFSVYIPAINRWKGAGFKYCTDDESFVSLEWLERVEQKSRIAEGNIYLEWSPNGTDMEMCRTFETRFTALEGLQCDFLMGRKNRDREFNRKAPLPPPPPSPPTINPYPSPSNPQPRSFQTHSERPALDTYLRPTSQFEKPSESLRDRPPPPRRISHASNNSSQRKHAPNIPRMAKMIFEIDQVLSSQQLESSFNGDPNDFFVDQR